MRGFSLIETILYIALLGLLLTGAVTTAYQLAQSSGQLSTKNVVEEEGDFVLRKITWAFGAASGITPSGSTLTINRYSLPTVIVRLNGSNVVELSEDNGVTYYPLTTANVLVSSLNFTDIAGSPEGVTTTLVINGATFTSTHYIRK